MNSANMAISVDLYLASYLASLSYFLEKIPLKKKNHYSKSKSCLSKRSIFFKNGIEMIWNAIWQFIFLKRIKPICTSWRKLSKIPFPQKNATLCEFQAKNATVSFNLFPTAKQCFLIFTHFENKLFLLVNVVCPSPFHFYPFCCVSCRGLKCFLIATVNLLY